MERKLRAELQVTSTECGVCCVAMILRHLGCDDSTNDLRHELDVGRDGLTLSQLRGPFEARGVATKLYRANLGGLRELTGPVILFWENYHFVVLERLTDRAAVVLDPAVGRRKLTIEEFQSSYSGLLLHPQPGPARSLHRPAAWTSRPTARAFTDGLRASRSPLAVVLLATLASYGGVLVMPWLTQRLIDGTVVRGEDPWSGLTPLVIGACVIGLAGASFLRAVMVAEVSVRVGRIAATRIMTHLLSLPLKFFDTRAPSELAYRLSGLAAIRDTLSSQVIAGVLEIGTVAVFLGYLIDKSLVLTALVAGLVLLVVLLLFGTRRAVYTAIQNEVVQVGKAQTQQIEAIQSILTMKSNGSSAFFLRRWTVENDLALHYLGERSRIQGAVNAVLGGVQTGGPLVVLMTGLALWGDGHLSIGDAIAAQAITISLFGSVSSIYSSITQVMLCQQYARRLHDITESEPEPVGQHRGTTWAPLEVAGATYRYSRTAPPVLEDVSMVVGPGEKVAVVGATGSGKSTLARLLLGLYPPSSGSVRMGGHDLRDTDRDHVLRNVAFVPQSITLETMSVRRNIDQGRDLPLEQVRLAAQRAGVAAEIEALPMGYETLVGNLGENFSGGQRQRIGIARALASDPSMLVLDEATSSLDHATEVSIMQRVTELDCAAVIIAHRLASVRRADRIYVLDRGRVVEVGTHEELMTKRGRYWDMFSGQLEVGNALEEVAS